jgi:2-dehydro-3-deoxyphosphogluconate aldolase/(4S)-4-hydroxy-2-oxoglutarate aldolase
MSREQHLTRIHTTGIVAVVRVPDGAVLTDVAAALVAGGVTAIEVTLTVPDALTALRHARQTLGPQVTLGAGTVLDTESARAALLAGADFLVAPTVNVDVIRLARRYDKVVMPGAFTPTEVLTAWEAGADVVKVFPAEVLGPAFFRALRGPLPQVRLMPTGGVDLTTVLDLVHAGVYCLGIGGQLVDARLVAGRQWSQLTELARQYLAAVARARNGATA